MFGATKQIVVLCTCIADRGLDVLKRGVFWIPLASVMLFLVPVVSFERFHVFVPDVTSMFGIFSL
jgi:hypothetical protein